MNLPSMSTPVAVSVEPSSEVETRLPGRWLVIARSVWVALVALSLVVFVVSIPAYFVQLLRSSPEQLRALEQVGLSPGLNAFFNVALIVATAMVCFALAGLIFWRKSDDRLTLLASLMLIMQGVAGTSVLVGPLEHSSSIWSGPAFFLDFFSGFLVGIVFWFFPDGRLAPRWLLWPIIAYVAGFVALAPTLLAPLALPAPSWLGILGVLLLAGAALALVVAQIYRYRRLSGPVQRQQAKWAVFGIGVSMTVFAGGYLPSLIFPSLSLASSLYGLVFAPVWACAPLVLPVSIGIAILRYRLWDIDIIINRTLVYGALTASVVGLYTLVVVSLGTLFQAQGNVVISLLATSLVAVLFQPLRDRLQRVVNRLMYGERDDPYRVISRLGRRLEETLAPEAVLPTIVETVAQALKLPYAAITLKQGDAFTIAAAYGISRQELVRLPLIYQHEQVGELVLAPRARGETFSSADRGLLDDLARQAGIAAHAVSLTADLQHSRERLVTAREEERRRLRRDLHDGLGPTLAALNLQAGAVRTLIPQDPAAADALVAEWRTTLRAVIADIRRLVYELRPPALDELGLVGAIREQAAQYGTQADTNGLQVAVTSQEALPSLPAAVEVAVYRIAQEALANVVRHSQAHTCYIRLGLDEALHLEITDDGVGLPAEHHAGVGLLSMRERAGELGGSCIIEPAVPSGTRVSARFPLPEDFLTDHLSEASRESGVGGRNTEIGSGVSDGLSRSRV